MKGVCAGIVCLLASTVLADDVSIALSDTSQGVLSYRDGVFSGPMASQYQCAIDRLNQTYTVTTFPRPRALRMLELHQVDLVMPLVRTLLRDSYASFPGALFEVEFQLFTRPPESDPPPQTRQIAVVWTSGVLPLLEDQGYEIIPVDSYQIGAAMVKERSMPGCGDSNALGVPVGPRA